MRLWVGTVLRLVVASLVVSFHGVAAAQPAEPATRVGGDLAHYGEKLAVLRNANAKALAAARGTPAELAAAWQRIAQAPSTRGFGPQLGFIAGAFVLLAASVFLTRRLTARWRTACRADTLHARGAAGLLALDGLDRLVVAVLAYVAFEWWCDIETTQDFLAAALVWAAVRWWLALWVVQALLRPRDPEFRLVPMSDAAAAALSRLAAVTLFLGIAAISVMPVLLRAQLPIPNAQFVALVQGLVMAAGGAIGLALFRRLEPRPSRFWFAAAAAALVLLWLAWSVGVLLLTFSIYHSLVWSLRIAVLAFIVDAVLARSAATSLWIPLAHRSIRVAAILAIAILLAEVWVVDELALVERAAWEPVRRSLVTAALTLVAGYVAWRWLHHWTEARLRAAVPALGEAEDAERAPPASRLTTVLPVLRILAGITIVVMAALVALSQLGVNIAPLLAGAGVIGLAISFGSQALVRDIVSGIFFMADDAFRVGEYIDTGKLKGTVERISLRSVRLRHQNGQIHTIPFGQLTSITNFSRDWQTVKFNLRLARDSDIEKVRKTVKAIGAEMARDPELGRELLQPLKLQGVADIADSAIVVRLKFTARPLKPSWVQREALKRIYKVFGEKGIEFASNAVTVQAAGVAAAAGAAPAAELAGGAAAAQRAVN
jgi:small-conductance mechanosensitive channel